MLTPAQREQRLNAQVNASAAAAAARTANAMTPDERKDRRRQSQIERRRLQKQQEEDEMEASARRMEMSMAPLVGGLHLAPGGALAPSVPTTSSACPVTAPAATGAQPITPASWQPLPQPPPLVLPQPEGQVPAVQLQPPQLPALPLPAGLPAAAEPPPHQQQPAAPNGTALQQHAVEVDDEQVLAIALAAYERFLERPASLQELRQSAAGVEGWFIDARQQGITATTARAANSATQTAVGASANATAPSARDAPHGDSFFYDPGPDWDWDANADYRDYGVRPCNSDEELEHQGRERAGWYAHQPIAPASSQPPPRLPPLVLLPRPSSALPMPAAAPASAALWCTQCSERVPVGNRRGGSPQGRARGSGGVEFDGRGDGFHCPWCAQRLR